MGRLIGFDLQLLFNAAIAGFAVLCLFFILSYLLFNPLRDALQKRRERVAADLSNAAKDKEEAAQLKDQYEQKLSEVRKEADSILEEARKKAKTRENEIIREAKEEAARITDRANAQIELAKKKALDEVKTQMVEVASLMAAKAVRASMNVEVNAKLVDETLREMGEGIWQSE